MAEFIQRSLQPVSATRLFDWHASPGAFERLVPPTERVRVLLREGGIADGDRVVLAMGVGPATVRWEAVHRDLEPGRGFTDVQVAGPFARWSHRHEFEPVDEHHAVLSDRVLYRLPGRAVGDRLAGAGIRARLARTFAWRHARTALDLRRLEALGPQPLRVVVSGASGLVGGALVDFLRAGGHTVERLVRKRPTAPGEIFWDPSRPDGEIDLSALEGADVVVHLAGESIAARWSAERKARILDSRRTGTRRLATALAALKQPPRVLVAASAVGYYGDGGDAVFDEDHRVAGKDFLAEVCQAWELATEPARQAGIRVVNLRFGVVLAAHGGALAAMLPAFRLGLGGPVGTGRQWMSWIGLDDALGAIAHAIATETLSGPVNAVAPQPVTNAEFGRTLGAVLARPAVLPLPQAAVVALFGEMGQIVLLNGQRVVPTRLQESGFAFATPWLEEALTWELGRVPAALAPPTADESAVTKGQP